MSNAIPTTKTPSAMRNSRLPNMLLGSSTGGAGSAIGTAIFFGTSVFVFGNSTVTFFVSIGVVSFFVSTAVGLGSFVIDAADVTGSDFSLLGCGSVARGVTTVFGATDIVGTGSTGVVVLGTESVFAGRLSFGNGGRTSLIPTFESGAGVGVTVVVERPADVDDSLG